MDLLRRHVDAIASFLEPNREFINCHMVDYLTEQHWKRYVPKDVQGELHTVKDLLEVKEAFWNQFDSSWSDNGRFPAVRKFLHTLKQYRVDASEGLVMDLEGFRGALDACRKETRLKMPELMSVKKCHEVEIAAAAVASLSTVVVERTSGVSMEDIVVIDAGDGKGYLSSRVALEHGLKVLGVDYNETNSINAEKRRDKLKKKVPNALRKSDLNNDTYFCKLLTEQQEPNYKTTTKLIGPDTDLVSLGKEHFPHVSDHCAFCLSGLHTCGNLGPTCLRLFHQNTNVRAILNVGCCYHLLSEAFSDDPQTAYGFPMSAYLRDRRYFLGRNSRNLAAESIERACLNRENPNDKLGYRALLQIVLLHHGHKMDHQVGRIKCNGFLDYVRRSMKKLGLDDGPISDACLERLQEAHWMELEQLRVFYLLRQQFAPVVEALILLDRLLYLRECGYTNSYLVKLFEPVVSPRCYSLIAFK